MSRHNIVVTRTKLTEAPKTKIHLKRRNVVKGNRGLGHQFNGDNR